MTPVLVRATSRTPRRAETRSSALAVSHQAVQSHGGSRAEIWISDAWLGVATNTGPTVVNGNLGLDPGSSVTGFSEGILNGTAYIDDAAAVAVQASLLMAYNDAAGLMGGMPVTADIGGSTITPGLADIG